MEDQMSRVANFQHEAHGRAPPQRLVLFLNNLLNIANNVTHAKTRTPFLNRCDKKLLKTEISHRKRIFIRATAIVLSGNAFIKMGKNMVY